MYGKTSDVQGQAKLNPEQLRAVEHGDGPLLVLAGAGTGKTRVLVHRIARLMEKGASPRDILAVTFSNKAAGEMRSRLRGLLGIGAERMWIGTFHGTCARLLRAHGEHVGLRPDFTILDDDDQKRILNALLKENGLDEMASPQAVRSHIDRAKNRGEDPLNTGSGPSWADNVLGTIYPLYKERLLREGAVDFNDLLLKALELAEHPDAGLLVTQRFRYVLVDEFQDTNRIQYRLVRYLAEASRNLTVVGDDDQSIYSWRGAEPRNLLDFDRDFPDATIIKLEQNYRSTQMILDAANGVIARNYNRRGKALWTEHQGGEPVLWEECESEREEADFIARAVLGLVEEEGRDYGDIAILYRTHAQSRVLEEQLRRYQIEYRIVGGVSFFQRKEIKDVLCYLRLITNPDADLYFERVVNVPTRGIGKSTLDRVQAYARDRKLSLFEAARSCSMGAISALGASPRKKLASFIGIIDGLRDVQAAGASVAEVIIQAVERSGYRERLEIEDTPEAQDRLANLAELVTMASDFDEESGGKGTLIDFNERISLSSANDLADGRGGTSVTLMTIHAAKGLEFPVVFLVGMEDGLFPSLRARDGLDESDSLEEERRLAYVAMTRAQERLVLTSAKYRWNWNDRSSREKMIRRRQEISRFLDEIPAHCMAVRLREPVRVVHEEERRSRPAQRPQVSERARARYQSHDEFDQRVYDMDEPTYDVSDDFAMDISMDIPLDISYDDEGGRIGEGDTVSHRQFGLGTVIHGQGRGKNRRLLIEFRDFGRKTVLERFVELAQR